jgi:signal transduction histidine kinase
MNAIQAMPYGSGELRLETKKAGDCAQINIIDTGQGIAPEDLEHIFDPFFTKKEGGLGFGLAIVQRIIEDHQGAIHCMSEVGKGTNFEIILPLHPGNLCKEFK